MSRPVETLNDSAHDVITYDFIVNGSALDPAYQLLSISITKEVNRITTARIVFRDGNAAEANFPISNKEECIPGNEIQIKVGRDSKNATLFKGIIIKQKIKISESGNTELLLECKDLSVRMTLGRKSQYFENNKDSDVIESIIKKYSGLTSDVSGTDLVHKELVQYNCTDWDFILSRAEVNSRIIIVDDGKINVKKPNLESTPTLSVSYGTSLLEFDAELDARSQWKSVEAKSWNYSNQSLFEQTTDNLTISEPGNIKGSELANAVGPEKLQLRHSGQLIESELKQWTESAMLKSRLSKICGRLRINGEATLKPGQTLKILGVGDRFNGKVFISAVRHDIGNGTWDTHVQFGLNPGWFHQSEDIIDTPAAGLIPAIHGLQIGKVVQLQNDPDGEDRILVRLPIIDNSAKGIWARVSCLDAGKNRGTFFRPEIDDEVIVGFVNDDPRDAIVLGMLNSSAHPAPINSQDTNHEKGIVTRSNLRIHFHDDSKTISISTPAGNKITLDEQNTTINITDQNKNTMTLEPSGITIDSPKNITIKAGGNIDLKATSKLNISALQINASAQGTVKIQGASTKLAGSGITEISGSLVKIN